MEPAEIAIIGGTGMYDAEMIGDAEETRPTTPYGETSGPITVGTFMGRRTAFLARHGRGHTLPPHMINYRANIDALRQLGVRRVFAPSAVGSLREEVAPGDFALPSQFIDLTRSRAGSFSEAGRVIHISMADPFCPELRKCAAGAASGGARTLHRDATYVCVEGPRFSTRAESALFRSCGAHVIGMTLVPECQLAREARMCYASISMVTDYDVWADRPVSAGEVARVISENARAVREVLAGAVGAVPAEASCACAAALDEAEL